MKGANRNVIWLPHLLIPDGHGHDLLCLVSASSENASLLPIYPVHSRLLLSLTRNFKSLLMRVITLIISWSPPKEHSYGSLGRFFVFSPFSTKILSPLSCNPIESPQKSNRPGRKSQKKSVTPRKRPKETPHLLSYIRMIFVHLFNFCEYHRLHTSHHENYLT